jgi:hypothetical protein
MTDEQILNSWNEINKRIGLPPIVTLGPRIDYDLGVFTEEQQATEIGPSFVPIAD